MKTVAILLVLALTAGTSQAQTTFRHMKRGGEAAGQGHMAMMQKLNLTEAQQTQVDKLRVDFQKKQIQTQAKIRLARLDLSQLLQADKPDRGAIEKGIRETSSIETEAKLARLDHMMAVRALLTPEQQKIWKEEMMDRRGSMRGFGRHGRGLMDPGEDMHLEAE